MRPSDCNAGLDSAALMPVDGRLTDGATARTERRTERIQLWLLLLHSCGLSFSVSHRLLQENR